MKNRIYFILLLIAGTTNAQNIVFTGTVFKDKLLQSSTSNSIAKDNNGTSIQIDANNDLEISITEANAVYELYIDNASLVNLDGIENFTNLKTLDFSHNSVSSVSLSNLVNLQTIIGNHNSLTTIDLSALLHLLSTDVSNNLLETIYAKNGTATDTIDLSGGSNTNGLSYICVDEAQIATIIGQLPGDTTCVVNSYCTATPGGDYTTLSGKIVFDATANGIDASDAAFPFVKVKAIIGSEVLQTISDQNGNYVFYTQQTSGSYSVAASIENDSVFIIPSAFNGTLGANATYDFALAPVAMPVPDLEIVVAPSSSALSGMNAVYQVTYKNKGSKKVNGNALVTYDSLYASAVSSSDANASITTAGQVSLNFFDLLPFETRSFYVTLALNSSATTGSSLLFNASITDNLGATEPTTAADNAFTFRQAVGTISHNTINCLEGDSVGSSQIGNYLHYGIDFENLGTAVATNVTVKMVFDTAKYDLNSLQLLNSSHPLDLKVDGTTALFNLRNANLGGPGGHGGILLKIKSNANLTAGSIVTSGAELFFDYGPNFNTATVLNSTAATNIATTTFQTLNVTQNLVDTSIAVSPNPTASMLFITSPNKIKTIALYDLFGRLLQTDLTDSDDVSIDVTQRSAGIYFLKITSDKGQKIEKIIKK
jgi:hypothetical protein